MDNKILILYVNLENISAEDARNSFQVLQEMFPNRTCICLSIDYSLEEVEKDEAIEKLQKMIEYLRQE